MVPGSGLIKEQASAEGLDRVFLAAGFEWREPGCSMCLAMNEDRLEPGERCASTSNRNFEGRQGPGGRTHLVSPEMAAAAAIAGPFRRRANIPARGSDVKPMLIAKNLVLALCLWPLAACNTVEGLGKDTATVGSKIESKGAEKDSSILKGLGKDVTKVGEKVEQKAEENK